MPAAPPQASSAAGLILTANRDVAGHLSAWRIIVNKFHGRAILAVLIDNRTVIVDYLAVLNSSPVGMLLVDRRFDIVFANAKAEAMFGYASGELNGKSVNCLVPESMRQAHDGMMSKFFGEDSTRGLSKGRYLDVLHRSGELVKVEIGLMPVEVDGNKYILVSALEIANEILNVAAHKDALTGLPNRGLFVELARNLRSLAVREGAALSLLFIDLDGFKHVNDNFGHQAGDRLLGSIANVLEKNRRKNDIVGRYGGDEFVMCLYDVSDCRAAEKISRSIIADIETVADTELDHPRVSASIGQLFLASPDELTLEQSLETADELMYRAKKAGKGQVLSREIGG
jgi:diguanylate cyclase (GGDEF)-like protein/PAS domain S-box-containing protein